MDLSLSPRHQAFREEVRRFLAEHGHKAPRGHRGDHVAWQKLLIEHGYAARFIPREYGGYGAPPDILEARIIAEEFGRAQVSPGLQGQGVSMLVPTLLEVGTEEQKRRFIPPTLTGEMIWCQGYSEPQAGSDLASLRTSAVLDGDHWVVNGQKIWTSTAREADWMFALVRTEPEAPKHEGISFLLIDMRTPGIEVRPLVDMTMEANFNEVFFTDVRVPKENIVGRRGEGWRIANLVLRHERGSLADPNAMMARLLALIDLMKAERVDGRRAIDDPVLLDRLMRIEGRVQALRANDLRLLSAKVNPDHGDPRVGLAGLLVKLETTELRHELEGLAVDAMGEFGILYDRSPELRAGGTWVRSWMYYLGLIIGGGTSQIQKNIIAERGLGLPREPRTARP
ncbi:MAG: acyl-CoA dehydrogenase family protein [Sphingomonadaceae bacterium]|uniref:acyl-CoA dehydrogenase family protein n=1 Tax=Thermaurantiacus sp. TaxID=2820283 RepID=UPI00298F3DA4|nr:acyl-CoA dehydrogenase family protein [Thermaurantiacus sp.]MCS6987483.1 acyl-CoA dehydrogenase family protein [Sphingomonadaceae bacterium]MDW8415403.1 acyl-CoA dehydrogenase family protein [Thermaurantiacus sp.]